MGEGPGMNEDREGRPFVGRAGDLLLVFGDALTRSWKQIIKFRPEGSVAPAPPAAPRTLMADDGGAGPSGDDMLAGLMEGLVRDERGVRLAREAND